MEDEIEEFRLLPEMIKSLEKSLQKKNTQAEIWLLLIKDVIAQQATSFDTLSVFYACNPQVSKTYRECAAALRTPEEHEATEEEYQEKLKQMMKQMGVETTD